MKIIHMVAEATKAEAAERRADVEAMVAVVEDEQNQIRADIKAVVKSIEDQFNIQQRCIVELRQRLAKLEDVPKVNA
jgi:hypothetical protein